MNSDKNFLSCFLDIYLYQLLLGIFLEKPISRIYSGIPSKTGGGYDAKFPDSVCRAQCTWPASHGLPQFLYCEAHVKVPREGQTGKTATILWEQHCSTLFHIFSFIIVLGRGTVWYLQMFLQCKKHKLLV